MRCPVALIVTVLCLDLATALGQSRDASCASWQVCRQLALDAAQAGDYETFHTLAWRAVQTGPANDAALLYLLARAQSLSGRPHDALVMLRRLAERGVPLHDAETLDDFRRVRRLAGWPETLARLRGPLAASTPPRTPVPAPAAAPSSPPVRADAAPLNAEDGLPRPAPESDALLLPPSVRSPVALAYDAVSGRIVLADDESGTLKVLSELSGNSVNLVSRGWAGAGRAAAIAIDPVRGDLWAATSQQADARGASTSAVHRLQLVSGRVLYSLPVPSELGAVRPVGMAVAGGTVFVLDADGRRVLEHGGDVRTLRVGTPLDFEPTSLAIANDVLYIAHAAGIVWLERAGRTSRPVTAAPALDLSGLHSITMHARSLLGIRRRPDGTQVAVRIRLDRGGHRATAVDEFGPAASRASTVVGGVFYYLAPGPGDRRVVRRIRLR